MKVVELTTEGFKVPDGTYSFRAKDGPRDVVLVTGPPGSGKTMLLQLLGGVKEAFAPLGAPADLRRYLRSGRTAGRLTATFALTEVELARAKLAGTEQKVVVDVEPAGEVCSAERGLERAFAADEGEAPATRWELFPAHRHLRIADWHLPHPPLSAALLARQRLRADADKYAALRRVLHELVLSQAAGVARALDARGVALRGDEPELLAPYKAAVAAMSPDLRLVSVDVRPGTATPVLARRGGERLPISELTASEEQAVLFAFASVWLGLSDAVVLVDSPELHHATGEQAPFVQRLLALGRGNQTFLATSSAEVASLDRDAVIDLSKARGGRS